MSKTILIVDDEPRMTRTAERLLIRHGCNPVICPTIDEARVYIENSPPDLILLDIMFPGNDRAGIDFLAELKSENNQAKDIPVVMFTVRGEPEIERECLELGAAVYIRKMAVTKEIIKTIESCLGLQPGSLKPNPSRASLRNITRNIISNAGKLGYVLKTSHS